MMGCSGQADSRARVLVQTQATAGDGDTSQQNGKSQETHGHGTDASQRALDELTPYHVTREGPLIGFRPLTDCFIRENGIIDIDYLVIHTFPKQPFAIYLTLVNMEAIPL